ncbi:MAG: glycosyltransferase [Dehalococcoidia bacterium]
MTEKQAQPVASVIVATRNRPEDVARCLPTILANDYPDVDMILMDQSTDDATEKVVETALAEAEANGHKWELARLEGEAPSIEGLTARRRLIYRRATTVGATRSYNEALHYARGEVLAFTDDDCTVSSSWIANGVKAMAREPEAGILFGEFVPIPHDPSKTYIPSFRPERYRQLKGRLGRLFCDYVASGNMFVRRAVFDRLGGFDEYLGPGALFLGGDDVDLAYRTLRAGFPIVVEPKNAVVHWGKRDYADGSGQRLLRDYYYAVGARQMKQIRCGDALAAYAFARSFLRETLITLGNLVWHGRPTGAGRQLQLIKGALAGLSQPVNRTLWLYVEKDRGRTAARRGAV